MRGAFPLLVLIFIAGALLLWAFPRRRVIAGGTSLAPTTLPANLRQATFSAGCFWGVEEAFRHLPGVVSTAVGYSGGRTKNPTYEDVCTDLTGHAEAVRVTFDPARISYPELLDAFWTSHDPTTKDRQGPDIGNQYRSAIFYHDPEQEKLARASLKEVDEAHLFRSKIVTQIVPAADFYLAEDYHQKYFAKNGGTCHLGPATVHTQLAKTAAAARQPAASTAPSP